MSYRTSQAFERPQTYAELLREASALAAGVCEHRSGNDHGNPLCLATNRLIENMVPKRVIVQPQEPCDCRLCIGRKDKL